MMVDHFTKFGWAILIKNKKENDLEWFQTIIDILFKTKKLHLDNDWKFRNKVMENYLKENNVDNIIGVPYNSQHQGSVKSFNKTIKIFDIS